MRLVDRQLFAFRPDGQGEVERKRRVECGEESAVLEFTVHDGNILLRNIRKRAKRNAFSKEIPEGQEHLRIVAQQGSRAARGERKGSSLYTEGLWPKAVQLCVQQGKFPFLPVSRRFRPTV